MIYNIADLGTVYYTLATKPQTGERSRELVTIERERALSNEESLAQGVTLMS